MADDNRISATIPPADIAAITQSIQDIRSKLPFLISISGQERQELPKMGDKSVGFDDKCTAYMASNPEFVPGFIDVAEVNKDRELRAQMMQFFAALKTLSEAVSDTLLVVNSEIWMADLAYYQSVREAARRSRAGADTIYNDLRQRFPGSSRQSVSPPNP
jgi:hypothetical protein